MDNPLFTKKNKLYLVASTGDRKFLEIGAYSNSPRQLGLYQKITVTGIASQTFTYDFGDGPFSYEETSESKNAFSGLYIEGDLEVSNRILQSSANIGINESSSHLFSSNIGQGNFSSFSDPLLEIQTCNLGFLNRTEESRNSFNIGGNNLIGSGTYNVNLGFYNESSGSSTNSKIFGKNNINSFARNVSLFGDSNNLLNNLNSIIIGSENSLGSGYNNTLFGVLNSIKDVNYTTVIGERNYLSGVIQSDIYGDDHFVENSQDFILLGEGCVVSGVDGIISIGEDNILNSMFDGITIGNNNLMSNQFNAYSFGSNNSIKDDSSSLLIGRANTVIGQTGSIVIGSLNTINSIYDSEIHGSRNTLEYSTNSFILGSNNTSISGIRNFILGRSISDTKSLDSIIIGLDYTPTGKIQNTIDISNSPSSSIKIKQDRIDIKSPSSSLYYNDSALLTIDTMPILEGTGYTKILDNNLFDTNIISDYNYEKISKKIELQPFKYVNTETRILNITLTARELDPTLTVGGVFAYNSKYLVSGGYFVQRDLPDGKKDFISNNSAMQILFTGEPFGSGWGIKTKDTDKFLFGNYLGAEDNFPVSGWETIGDQNLSGLIIENMLDSIKIDGAGYSSIYTLQPDNSWNHSYDPNIKIFYSEGAYYPYTLKTNNVSHYRSNDLKTWNIFPGYNTSDLVYGSYNTFKLQPIYDIYTGNLVKQQLSLNDSFTDSLNNFNSVISYQDQNSLFSVIYGKPAESLEDLNWLIVDKYSSGIYYKNTSYNSSVTPQTGWILTGYGGYSGRYSAFPEEYIKNIGTKIVTAGNSSGVIALDHPSFGRVYVPCFL